ncbi:UNVERIFIED_CONTAM: hypothetical protein GTU68_043463 [Idotea baltica]|nr:hypothetical protein [Idotea baltica]
MFQGTGSDVGKSTLVTGLCRIARRRGLSVAPFKSQNMSNNAAACIGGGEIGRAQALQARACGLQLSVDFNPVLLKPQSDQTAQVVVHGKVLQTSSASDYMTQQRAHLKSAVLTSFNRLCQQYDLILVEGAGSPAEINLRQNDIANMGFATAVGAPVCLIGDIDRGGVIAAIAGTQQVISQEDASMIKSFIINRFRGDPRLFDGGVTALETITGWPALRLPQEDAVVLDTWSAQDVGAAKAGIVIAVPMLSRIANFDDLDPLRAEPQVSVVFVPPGSSIPLDADAVVIPGTKSTVGDMKFLVEQGWDHDITAIARRGGRVLGICGGFQLLGTAIHDPDGMDGHAGSVKGLGLLDVETHMQGSKSTRAISGSCTRSNTDIAGYEIHMGKTSGADTVRPVFELAGMPDGAISVDGCVEGTYVHGVFSCDSYRTWWLDSLKTGMTSELNYEASVEQELDYLADGLEEALDVDALLAEAAYASSLMHSGSKT